MKNLRKVKWLHVTAYEVVRCYGGPEEGGWWFNAHTPVETVRVNGYNRKAARAAMESKWMPEAYGNIYSVLGGAEYEVYVERRPGERATRCRPHYE